MQNFGAGYPSQPHSYAGTPQVIQPIHLGHNGGAQLIQINREAAKGLGITQIIIGIICFILNIVLLGISEVLLFPSYVGYGIWGGILVSFSRLIKTKKISRKLANY